MLDALVAEARDRCGLDLAAGLQLVAAEGITATPIEASRPLLIAPVEILGGEGGLPGAAAPPEPLPG
ncbi:MAG: hypothetical protein QOE42_2707, partial [Chloroflexota bacterium]|nr:hypothetical protein [Chloroflexota bacterium]